MPFPHRDTRELQLVSHLSKRASFEYVQLAVSVGFTSTIMDLCAFQISPSEARFWRFYVLDTHGEASARLREVRTLS